MKIFIKQLCLLNFKGIRNLVIDFKDITNIFGDNATGKTTIMDAFLWLLFGKDSTDRKDTDFSIKTLDGNNNAMLRLDHQVTAVLVIEKDGRVEQVEVKRLYKEKWQTKRGNAEDEFTGHTTDFFWNDVPLQLKEWKQKIEALCDEGIFKLLTNTSYFSNLDWKDRRDLLMRIAGPITDADIATGDADFEKLMKDITGKTLQEYRTQVAARKKLLKEQKDQIPGRRSEAQLAMPDDDDFDAIDRQIASKEGELKVIDDGIVNEANAAKEHNRSIRAKIDAQHTVQSEIQGVEFEIRQNINKSSTDRQAAIAEKKNELRLLTDQVLRTSNDRKRLTADIEAWEVERKDLGRQWSDLNSKVFDYGKEFSFNEDECTCPTCKQKLPDDNISTRRAQLKQNFDTDKANKQASFNRDKASDLKKVLDRGNDLKVKIDKASADLKALPVDTDEQVAQLKNEIALLEQEHTTKEENEAAEITQDIANSKKIADLKKKNALIQEEIDELNRPTDQKTITDLQDKKANLTREIDALKMRLHDRTIRATQKKRIEELDRQEREYGQQIADIDGIEYTIARFERTKMDKVEERVNAMFKFVQFRMFDRQINGQEVPACITLINGVPFADANNAARINAGLDIIRVFSQYHGKSVPVFVDNAESVTRLLSIDAQVIRLVVSAADKSLRIQSQALSAA